MSRSTLANMLLLSVSLIAGAGLAYFGIPYIEQKKAEHAEAVRIAPSTVYSPNSEAGAFLIAQRAEHDSDWIATHRALLQLEKMEELPPEQNARLFLAAIAAGDWDTARNVKKNHPEAVSGSAPIVRMLATILDWADNDPKAPENIRKIEYNPISQIVLPFAQGWMTHETPKLGIIEAAQDLSFSTVNMVRFYEAMEQYDKSDALMIKLQDADLNLRLLQWSVSYFERRGLMEQRDKALARLGTMGELIPPSTFKSEVARVRAEADGHLKGDKRALALTLLDSTSFLEQHGASAIALLYAQAALKLVPDLTEGQIALGSIYESQGNWEEAQKAYRSVPKTSAVYFPAQLRLLDVLAKAKRDDEAMGLYNDMTKRYPNDIELWFQKGEFLRTNKQDFRSAIGAYNKVESLLKDKIPESYWTLYLARGLSYEMAGDPDKALKDYERAYALKPDNAETLNTLAYSWAEKGIKLDEAELMLRKALMADPMAPHIIDSLGWVLFKKNEHEKAVMLLEQAVQMLPYDSTVNSHLGDAYQATGRTREAKFMWQRALENVEDDAKMRAELQKKLNP